MIADVLPTLLAASAAAFTLSCAGRWGDGSPWRGAPRRGGAVLLAHAPLIQLKRLLGVFLGGVVAWRRGVRPRLGAAGSVGPLTTPFFLAYGLTRAAYIGTEAAAALTMHLTKTMRRTSRRHRLQCFLSSADADVPPLSQWWMLIRSHLHSCLWRAQCVAPVTFIDLGLVHATAVAALAERYGVAIEVSS